MIAGKFRAREITVLARRLAVSAFAVFFLVGLTISYQAPGALVVPVPEKAETKEAVVRTLPSTDLATLAKAVAAEWLERRSADEVPNAAPEKLPSGLEDMDTSEKKTLFFRSILPHVLKVNLNIRLRRENLEAIAARLDKGETLSPEDQSFIKDMVRRYRSGDDKPEWPGAEMKGIVSELLLRVDEVPPSLVLAQAALESAWGSSRFAIEGNNIFGLWVFNATEGMIPRDREEGANFSVAKFDSLTESVESYVRHLNTLFAYEDFRVLRARMRQDSVDLDSTRLAEGLLEYSIRRDDYVQDVLNLIKANRLTKFDSARLVSGDTSAKRADEKQKPAYGPLRTKASDA